MSDPNAVASVAMPPGITPAPEPVEPVTQPVPAFDYAQLAREMARQGLVSIAQPATSDAPAPRREPDANLGRRCIVYLDGKPEPHLAFCTGNFYDDNHAGYIDIVVFPRGAQALARISVPPKDYHWLDGGRA